MRNKNGFTLIEMTVVMGMIAVLTLISIAALMSSRSQTMVDSMAQDIVSNIRDAQNRSVSTVDATNGNAAKVWAYQINSTNNAGSLYSYTVNGNVLLQNPEATSTSISTGTVVTITRSDGVQYSAANIAFSSPFGRPYINDGSNAGACAWQTQSNRPAQDWFISPTCGTNSLLITPTTNPNLYLKISLKYKNLSKTIIVRANGDSSIE